MLGANVLCLKKKKKRTYSLSTCKGHEKGGGSRNERARGGTLTMMQITEDTPPDMLAGAMDLTVHLPNGKAVKMSIERSTPMMDLLVQITTANHLQLSNHTLQVLGMAPSSEYSDKTLPFKPNTPIGTLDTQHIRVLPKGRVVPQPKSVPPPGHQPFESTFRLKVHLPRNQLYVTRVSRNVLLEDIMRKVCEEKNLDPMKYDFKHPGNLDEVLDPKLTLSDYQITEIYVVSKGTTNLNQAFSTTDIMVLRKEEERKQMHNKTGGGVFNLIFKRGKSSMGSGSVSSNDNRSISPTHSDDSRSVTPPAPPLKKEPPLEKPKPPQRKRRPAPKPPQGSVNNEEENLTNDTNEETRRPLENGLTICHSRNSSDSSGYHEASILSEHGANASLPRNRPKSMAFGSDLPPSQGTSNLTKMATHSRSTTSLIAGRKKKAAPPPPQIAVSPASSVIAHSEHPNPLVASQPEISHRSELPEVLETTPSTNFVPVPKPRKRPPKAPPRTHLFQTEREQIEAELGIEPLSLESIISECTEFDDVVLRHKPPKALKRKEPSPRVLDNTLTLKPAEKVLHINENAESKQEKLIGNIKGGTTSEDQESISLKDNEYSMEEILASLETVKPFIMKTDVSTQKAESSSKSSKISLQKTINIDDTSNETKPPEIVGMIKKGTKDNDHKSNTKDEMEDLDENMFTEREIPPPTKPRKIFNQLFGIHDYEPTQSPTMSLRSSTCSIPGFNGTAMKKWDNLEELDNIADPSCGVRNEWVVDGDLSETESIPTSNLSSQLAEVTPEPPKIQTQEEKSLESTDSGIAQDHKEDTGFRTPPPPPILDDIIVPDEIPKTNDLIDWEYQLPSPPKAFRDSSPQDTLLETNSLGGSTDFKDSVVTSPELFEKLRTLEDKESMISEEPPLNTLSLEHLEKRKSLVYNRELATSLKMTDSVESRPSVNSASMANFQKPAEKTARHHHDTLPNFKITTYDVPKHQNIKVFEDDTVRSNENVSYSKRNSEDLNSDISNTDYVFYKPQAVSRSGSFSTDAKTSTKPVSRSRSTLTLNKYHTTIKKELGDSSNISRSSSLFNVSGLHSLEVMKVIRNKLNTSTGSTENLQQTPQKPPPTLVVQREEPVAEEPPQQPDPAPVDSPKPAEPVKKYYYRGPPAVNMSTWSERPKVPVSVKEDEDYKLGNVNHNGNAAQKSEITQSSGNVVIKIGPATNSTRLMAPAAYRKPLGNLNGGSEPQRPHSIAFDSSFDINRVPVVRSVEFKKPYKDFHVNNSHLNNTHQINTHVNNTSIIHLNQEQSPLEEPQHNAFKVRSRTPIVRGFNSNRLSWHASSGGNFNSTLPLSKPKEDHYVPNQHVPFSQLTLRRTESSKRYMSDQNANNVVKPIVEPNNNNSNSSKPWSVSAPPPPPPQVPKKTISQKRSQSIKNNNNSEDVRDMLMESIRNFGGKKGLKTVKA
ncbi:protein cordon-bleu isoform X2 [Euwallacea similis]|uniref:protein cordon-bleu isoform X2 n=1 Tax=Euwallacea similis TaxID=1736056 RepID=UPI00344C61F7